VALLQTGKSRTLDSDRIEGLTPYVNGLFLYRRKAAIERLVRRYARGSTGSGRTRDYDKARQTTCTGADRRAQPAT
jgi:hypothetical protein